MPVVTIEWYEGRSDEQKATIAEKLTDVLVEIGDARDQVWMRFVDSAQEGLGDRRREELRVSGYSAD